MQSCLSKKWFRMLFCHSVKYLAHLLNTSAFGWNLIDSPPTLAVDVHGGDLTVFGLEL